MNEHEQIRLAGSVLKIVCKIPARPNVVVSFVEAEHILAKARLQPQAMEIEFGTANILLVRDLMAATMSLPNIFQDIGDCAKENGARVPRRQRFAVSLSDMSTAQGAYVFCEPLCQTRRFYVSGLVELAVHGIMFHELAHILLGHLHVLDKHEVTALGKQAMEWSADAYAAHLLAGSCADKSIHGMDMVFRALLLISSLDHEMWQSPVTERERPRKHPLPHHRIISAAVSIKKVAARSGIEWEPKDSDVVDLVVAHMQITGDAANVPYIADSFKSPDVEALEYWQREVRPLAQKYAFVTLPTTGPYDDDFYR